ncbi:LPXTG cell wall anchor domain-containing protein [Rhodococcus qingshengii]|jgi:LPXTG-motif cell wall-anchored protein|nr:LPXTG cell wall anchor domain-containing protein [Rhodococcus qingshengii]
MKKWKNTLTGVLLIGAGIGFLFRKRKEEQI